jgi:hypothetical protein
LLTDVEDDNAVLLINAVGAGNDVFAAGDVNGLMGVDVEVVFVMDIKD